MEVDKLDVIIKMFIKSQSEESEKYSRTRQKLSIQFADPTVEQLTELVLSEFPEIQNKRVGEFVQYVTSVHPTWI